jgi:hypothetical protein
MKKVLAADLQLRVGIIEMDENRGQTSETVDFLRSLGVERVGVDRLRQFGRADENDTSAMTELCGNCAGKTICVGPDGVVSPCIMAKAWAVGSVFDKPLAELSRSSRLAEVRTSIYREVVKPRVGQAATLWDDDDVLIVNCGPCEPACNPCNPYCSPGQQCFPCNPNSGQPCVPNGRTCQPR